jgi:dihydroorotate dehydrogenase/NAD-dependent dihydropyrimidine dehydrogenase PreA subunit
VVINYAGIEFKNPFVVASGPASATIDQVKMAEDCNAAGVSVKLTFSKVPFKSKLRTYSVPGEVMVMPIDRRLEEDEGLELVRRAREETSVIIFANMSDPGTDIDKWCDLARKFEQAGAHIIETNFCCPNIGLASYQLGRGVRPEFMVGGSIGQIPELSRDITRELKKAVNIPVVNKLTPTSLNMAEVALACQEGGADGISLLGGTSLAATPVDIYSRGKPVYPLTWKNSFGFISGPWIKLSTYKSVAQVAQNVSIPICASGGISNWRDNVEMIMWGATLTSACTVLMWEGFEVIKDIVEGTERFMEEQGYSSYEEMRGLALQHLATPDEIGLIEGAAVVDKDKCIGCGKCVKPAHCNAVELKNGKANIDPEKCVACSVCVVLCPVQAIRIEEV